MVRKVGAAVPPFWKAGSPFDTKWPGPSPNTVPSGTLIQTVAHNMPMSRKDSTDNGPIAYGELFYKRSPKKKEKLECGPMPNVMVALPNIGGALCSTPQSLADAHY